MSPPDSIAWVITQSLTLSCQKEQERNALAPKFE